VVDRRGAVRPVIGYPGSKGGMGVCQQIISLMPAHDRYIEPYFGGGAVFYAKRPAAVSIVSDIDVDVMRLHERDPMWRTEYRTGDALSLIESLIPSLGDRDLIYLDPPYLPETRVKKKLYNFETDSSHHAALLAMLDRLHCSVMLSGYRSPLYDRELADWHRHDFQAMTRGGPRIESVWCNFAPGLSFHDPRFVGGSYRERERIKRKKNRWVSRLKAMPAAERAMIWDALSTIVADAAAVPQQISSPVLTCGDDA
jgi:DNA adenine methylase